MNLDLYTIPFAGRTNLHLCRDLWNLSILEAVKGNKEMLFVNQEDTFKVKKVNDIIVITTLTDFTLSMERIMEDLYMELCNNGYKKILFEFNPENHITSAGIAILISLIDEGTKNNQKIGIIGLSSHFKKIFNLIGITRYATIYNSVEQAIQKMSGSFSSEWIEQSN